MWLVIRVATFPKQYKVVHSLRPTDNSPENFFTKRMDAEKEANKRNLIEKERIDNEHSSD